MRSALNGTLFLSVLSLLLFCAIPTAWGIQSFNNGSPVLITNGHVVTELSEHPNTDVLIVDGKIQKIGPNLLTTDPNLAELQHELYIIDATDKIVMPGGIDPHTHISMPFMGTISADGWFEASKAGLAGGTTTIFDFVLPVDNSLTLGLQQWKERAAEQAPLIDYSYHAAVTGIYGPKNIHPNNATLDTLAEMYQIAEDEGITSFKFFLAYKHALMIRDDDFLMGLRACSKLGVLAMVHAENGDAVYDATQQLIAENCTHPSCHLRSRPAVLEAEATNRASILAQFAEAALYVVHVQSVGAVEAIARVRASGYKRVVGEAVVSGFTLDERDLLNENFDEAAKYVMSPPFHIPEVDGVALIGALHGEDSLQTIGTDHATFTRAQKRCINPETNGCTQENPQSFHKIPNGVNGIEERMAMTYTKLFTDAAAEKVDLAKFVRLTSTNAAKIFGVYPQKGSMIQGGVADADIIIFDPSVDWVVDQGKQNIHPEVMNVFHGLPVKGKVVTTLSRGRVLYQDGDLAPGVKAWGAIPEGQRPAGHGKFLGRKQFSSELYKDAQKYKNQGHVSVDANGNLTFNPNPEQKRPRHDEL